MPRELITNVWASDNQGWGPGTANGPMLPDHLAADFDDRPEVFAPTLDALPEVEPGVADWVHEAEARAAEVTVDLPPAPPLDTSLADMDRSTLIAELGRRGIEHNPRWGAKRLRAALEAAGG